MAPSTSGSSGEDLDAAYHEYLWGGSSPRSFARKSLVVGAKKEKVWNVTVGEEADLSRYV